MIIPDPRPCKGQNVNICVGEGCYGEACMRLDAPMISARAVCIPWLGRRWRAHCHRCNVDLPGRHADRHDALAAGDEHLVRWHERAGVGG